MFLFLIAVCVLPGCGPADVADSAKINAAVSQVRRIAAGIQRPTNDTESHQEELEEVDPWGTKIVVFYPEGGKFFCVRAPGPDREAFTADDIQSSGGEVLVGDVIAKP